MSIKRFESTSIQAFEKSKNGMGVQGLPFLGTSTALNPLPSDNFFSNLYAIGIRLIIQYKFRLLGRAFAMMGKPIEKVLL